MEMITVTTNLNPDFIAQEIAVAGQLTVKELMALSGKAETTVRTVLKTMVEESRIVKVDGVKPAAYRMITEPEVNTTPDEVDDDESKLDEIMSAITAQPADEAPVKIKKSRKVGRTEVPDEYNVKVLVDGQEMWVTEAYALLPDPPQFVDVTEVIGIALESTSLDVGASHTDEQIAALYYRTVADYLELLHDEEAITYAVWYGRTCRLRHLVVGHGRGTAAGKSVDTTGDE